MNKKGRLITFEGIDGSGKTKQAKLFYDWVVLRGHDALSVREPGETGLGNGLRGILLHDRESIDTRAELLLFEAARAQLTSEIIIPEIEKGTIIVCDRYFDSTTAYQGYAGEIDMREVEMINMFATKGLRPDLTFLIDVEPEIAWRKMVQEKQRDKIESRGLDYQRRLREAFLDIARKEHERMVVVRYVEGDLEGMHGYIADIAEKKLGL